MKWTVLMIIRRRPDDPLQCSDSTGVQEAQAPKIQRTHFNGVCFRKKGEGRVEGMKAGLGAYEVGGVGCTDSVDLERVFWGVGQQNSPDRGGVIGSWNTIFWEGIERLRYCTDSWCIARARTVPNM